MGSRGAFFAGSISGPRQHLATDCHHGQNTSSRSEVGWGGSSAQTTSDRGHHSYDIFPSTCLVYEVANGVPSEQNGVAPDSTYFISEDRIFSTFERERGREKSRSRHNLKAGRCSTTLLGLLLLEFHLRDDLFER